jgi:hypothetical protein
MAREIIGIRIHEAFLALRIGTIEALAEIQPMRPFVGVKAHPKLRTLRTQGIKPFLILGDFGFPLFEFIAPRGLSLIDSGPKKHENYEDEFFHGFPPLRFCAVAGAVLVSRASNSPLHAG